MRLLHMADFHLDSAFSGFDKDVADQKREELRECFVNTLRKAKEEGVSLALIAGDLFDTPFCTAQTRRVVWEAIEEFGLPVVIAPGNHDHYIKNGAYADKSLPENAFVFTSPEMGRFDFDELGISVLGYAFTSDRYESNPLDQKVPLSLSNVNILCAHGELGTGFSKYAPLNANEIASKGFAYAALGHVHIAPEPTQIGDCIIAYCGFPQGRSFDELGEGGSYIVEINDIGYVTECRKISLSKLSYTIDKIDVTSLGSDEEIIAEIDAHVKKMGYGKDTALRVELVGAVNSDYTMSISRITSASELSHLAMLQIKNKTSATLGIEYLESDMTIRGEVYRSLLPLLNSADPRERECASLALKFALNALDKREIGIE